MVRCNVVADEVAKRPPDKLDFVFGEDFASPVNLCPILHLGRHVVQALRFELNEVHRMMIDAAPHEDEVVTEQSETLKPSTSW